MQVTYFNFIIVSPFIVHSNSSGQFLTFLPFPTFFSYILIHRVTFPVSPISNDFLVHSNSSGKFLPSLPFPTFFSYILIHWVSPVSPIYEICHNNQFLKSQSKDKTNTILIAHNLIDLDNWSPMRYSVKLIWFCTPQSVFVLIQICADCSLYSTAGRTYLVDDNYVATW